MWSRYLSTLHCTVGNISIPSLQQHILYVQTRNWETIQVPKIWLCSCFTKSSYNENYSSWEMLLKNVICTAEWANHCYAPTLVVSAPIEECKRGNILLVVLFSGNELISIFTLKLGHFSCACMPQKLTKLSFWILKFRIFRQKYLNFMLKIEKIELSVSCVLTNPTLRKNNAAHS